MFKTFRYIIHVRQIFNIQTIARDETIGFRQFCNSGFDINKEYLDIIEKNILIRKHRNNVPLIRSLLCELHKYPSRDSVKKQIVTEIRKLPNSTHNRLVSYGEKPREIYQFLSKASKNDEFSIVCKFFNFLRTEHLGHYTGHKSYYLMGDLAALEQKLIRYTVMFLKKIDFRLVCVPDILPSFIINGCGMQTEGNRTQVYKIDTEECLSGTSEMALAGLFSDKIIDEKELPLKVAAVSRCYRAETSGLNEEKGIYRVHQFNKVEMFAVCSENASEDMLESFRETEVSLFKQFNLNFRVLDMPPTELGASAFQKYDIEAWLPGRQMWGEISSCSNCTDYQAKRLNIRYRTKSGELKYAHTVNGTAAAIPRLLIALIESNKVENGAIFLPREFGIALNANLLKRNKIIPAIKLVKHFKV
ncbi:serine--tRNA ligase, mitochondrial [Anastrepha obliqua]|uniref:serine--tRNA ligase, mitochondrial n=1 Tax=Anastrepha obliqua TaxID=95512 RepID=UPI00240963F7|nr:serine--tRNA ligase, mitochondrial [Anastrepha obliqua]